MDVVLPDGYDLVYAPAAHVAERPHEVILVHNGAIGWRLWVRDAQTACYRAWQHRRISRSAVLNDRQWFAMQRIVAGTDPAAAQRCRENREDAALCAAYRAFEMELRYAPEKPTKSGRLLAD